MPPKRPKSASKTGASASAKDSKKKDGEALPTVPDPAAIRRKELKGQYLAFCKQYMTEPLPCVVKRIDEAIERNKEIQQLIVDSSQVRTSDIAAIRSTFRKYTPLVGLCFWHAAFHDTSLSTLTGLFLMKQTLCALQLVGNGLCAADAMTIACLCRESDKLKSLVLDHNGIGDGSRAIFEALCENPSCALQKLSMRYCALTAESSPQLADLIRRVATLKWLDLGGNTLRDNGLPALSSALGQTKTLVSLNLAFNEISDVAVAGTVPFAELCRCIASSTLTLVDLSGNFIDDHGMDKLFDMQQSRKSAWSAGRLPPLKLIVPERANKEVFDAIWQLNAQMAERQGRKG